MSEFNIKSSTIEKGLELAKGLLDKIAAPAAEELGLLFGDNVKHRRLSNQIKNLDKVRTIVEAKGLTLKQVNLKVLFPYLEGIAVEEDDTLQDMWANLFVNYIDSTSNLQLTVYPSILKQLSTNEVVMLKEASYIDDTPKFGIALKRIEYKHEHNSYELNNLERMGLMIEETKIFTVNNYSDRLKSEVDYTGMYTITNFGLDFIKACTVNNK